MASIEIVTCDHVSPSALDRLNYFPRQLITADDMRLEQEYFLERLRRHNRIFHGWGIRCGLEIRVNESNPWRVDINEGVAMDRLGNEIVIPAGVWLDLTNACAEQEIDPCIPCLRSAQPARVFLDTRYYLAVFYVECKTRPVRVIPEGCSCDDVGCEYSRIRESFRFILLDKLPDCYEEFLAEMHIEAVYSKASQMDPVFLAAINITEEGVVVQTDITEFLGRWWRHVER